jgi:hypothetical protein
MKYKNNQVRVSGEGRIIKDPGVLADPNCISKRTLRMMDTAMNNFAEGVRSEPIDVEEMRRIADALCDRIMVRQ